MADLKNIIWALSPFPEELDYHKRTAMALRAFVQRKDIAIQPVYVLSPDQLLTRAIETLPGWKENYHFAARESLEALIALCDLPGVAAPEIIVQSRPSIKKSAEALIDFAKATQTDLIAAGGDVRRFGRIRRKGAGHTYAT